MFTRVENFSRERFGLSKSLLQPETERESESPESFIFVFFGCATVICVSCRRKHVYWWTWAGLMFDIGLLFLVAIDLIWAGGPGNWVLILKALLLAGYLTKMRPTMGPCSDLLPSFEYLRKSGVRVRGG